MHIDYVRDDFLPIFGVIPLVFAFFCYIIFGDLKNMEESKKSYQEYTATDPINCYQNYKKKSQ